VVFGEEAEGLVGFARSWSVEVYHTGRKTGQNFVGVAVGSHNFEAEAADDRMPGPEVKDLVGSCMIAGADNSGLHAAEAERRTRTRTWWKRRGAARRGALSDDPLEALGQRGRGRKRARGSEGRFRVEVVVSNYIERSDEQVSDGVCRR
jgi:hypothetical protein